MLVKRLGVFVLWLAVLAGLVVVGAQIEGYEWMPPGGRQLLGEVLEHCQDCAALSEISEMDLSVEEWEEYFRARTSSRADLPEEELELGALAGFGERGIDTLLNYLALNLPASAESVPELPEDGSLIVLFYCTMCHAIATSMTQDSWTSERWLHLVKDGTHSALGFREADIEELAHYLALNPVPLEIIPPDQRVPLPGF